MTERINSKRVNVHVTHDVSVVLLPAAGRAVRVLRLRLRARREGQRGVRGRRAGAARVAQDKYLVCGDECSNQASARSATFRPKVAQNVMRVPCPLVLRPGVGDARSIERRTCSLPGSEGSSRGTSAEGLSAIALRSAGRACLRGREGGMEGSRGVRARGVRAISRGRWNWKERPARRPTGGGDAIARARATSRE
jgi:hypothetical protein